MELWSMIIGIMEERKEGEWLGHVEWMGHEACVQAYNNEQSAQFSGACMDMYTKIQTQWHIHCCHRWLNSLSQTLLHSHYNNTIDISTVVMLRFRLFQFNTGSLNGVLCLLMSTKFFFVRI